MEFTHCVGRLYLVIRHNLGLSSAWWRIDKTLASVAKAGAMKQGLFMLMMMCKWAISETIRTVLYIPYVPPILGQLLDLISPAKIHLCEPRFKSYDLWHMANCLSWFVIKNITDYIFFRNLKFWWFSPIFFQKLYSGTWTRTREPEPVLGNLYVLKLFIVDPYFGTWTVLGNLDRTWEPRPVLGNFSPFFQSP